MPSYSCIFYYRRTKGLAAFDWFRDRNFHNFIPDKNGYKIHRSIFLSKKVYSARQHIHYITDEYGLTFGTIASVFGLNSGIIDKSQYSVLIGVVIASAVIPTFIAQKWFMPFHSEDIVDI